MDIADLHIHSNASDGLLTPTQIIDWAIKKRLKAISITDHDSIKGIDTAIEYSLEKNIEFIPGIEFSTEYENKEIHILGYFINHKEPQLLYFLNNLKESRIRRAREMVDKINYLGYKLEFNEVLAIAQNTASIGRPHIARAMIEHGYCNDIDDAFDRFIGYGKMAYVERYKITPDEAVRMIKYCNGVSSIAHPGLIDNNLDKYKLIKELKKIGLNGIEVYHTKHTKKDEKKFLEIANDLRLVPTGGTDCHGVLANNEPILGSISIPYDNVIRLKKYLNNESD